MSGQRVRVHLRLGELAGKWQSVGGTAWREREGYVWIVAFVFSGVFVGTILLTLNRTYDYVDDLTVRDYVRAGMTSPFSGHLFSVVLGFLYSHVSRDFPWYGVCLGLVKWITLTIGVYFVLSRSQPRTYRFFFLIALLSMYTPLIMRFSWNASSILAGNLSGIALAESLQPGRRASLLKSVLLGVVFSLSYCIRRDGGTISIAYVLLPLQGLLFFMVVLRQASVKAVLSHTPLFLLPFLLVRLEDSLFINHYASPDERMHHLAQEARVPIYGYGVYGVLQDAPRLLRANGWTPNDVYMIAYAMTMDENKFSLDRFYNILNEEIGLGRRRIKRDIVYNLLHFGQLEGFKWYDPFAQSDAYGPLPYYPYYVAMITLTVLTVWGGRHWYDRLFALLYLIYIYLLNVYMINYLKLPWYVSHSVYTSFCVALFSCTELKPDIVSSRVKSGVMVIILLPLVFSFSGFWRNALLLHNEISVKRAAYLERYADFASRLGQDAFIFIRPQLYTEYFADPLAMGDQGPKTNYAALGVSSGAWSPIFYKLLNERGLSYGYQMFPWMVDNSEAYLVSRDSRLVERIRRFIYETYGILAEMQPVHVYKDGVVIYRLNGIEHFVPHYQPVYDFLDNLESAEIVAESPEYVRRTSFMIEGLRREVLFQHPPSRVSYLVQVPLAARLRFSTAVSPEAWGLDEGDGVQFDIYIETNESREKIFSEYLDPSHKLTDRGWHEHDLDIAAWGGRTVTIVFETSPGPAGDLRYDWAGWVEPGIGQVAYYDFAQKFYLAQPVPSSLTQEQVRRMRVDQSFRDAIMQHPPGVLSFPVHVKPGSLLCFGYGLDPAVWVEGKGDGVLFSISVSEDNSTYTIFSAYNDPKNNISDRRWFDTSISLEPFANKDVIITLSTSPGTNSDFDWAYWIAPRLVQIRQ